MKFTNLKPQPPLYPQEAENYAKLTLEQSELAASLSDRIADVRYGENPHQLLDIYPGKTGVQGRNSVLIFAHGGAWTNGYKEWMALMAPALNAAGITLISPSYRLAPEGKWRSMVEDCVSSIAWVHRNIHHYGGSPKRIAVGGHSAGGHLMTLAALSTKDLEVQGVPASSLLGCFPLCAPLDIRYPDAQPGSGEARTHQMILGAASEASLASPICHLSEKTPFILLAYALADLPRIIASNLAMESELTRRGLPHQKMLLNGDHFAPAIAAGDAASPWTQRVIQFLST
jgi:acetyl esterase/lipase